MFKFAILLSARDKISTNDELKIYYDAFKNYLLVKVLDDNVFAIIKSYCICYFSVFSYGLF